MTVPHPFLLAITDIGDSASLFAIVAGGSLYLFSRKSHRAAWFLIGSLLTAGALIGIFKVLFIGCHGSFHHFDLRSPSGHAADSTAVFLAYAILMRSQLEDWRKRLPLVLLMGLALLIGYSRVKLGYHTTEEVVVGVVTGLAAIGIMRFFLLRHHGLVPFDAYVLALWGILAGIVAHGWRMPIEGLINKISLQFKGHIPFCKDLHL